VVCRRWTLNWDEVREDILVGSCPRSVEDVVSACTRCAAALPL
jgi:hypothetical protein